MDRLLSYRVFTRVVDHASFARAAQELGMSAATVSAHVAQLEAHLGVTLLNRTTRSVSLSDEGRDFYERVIRILAQVQEAEDAFSPADRPLQGRLRVDVSPTVAVHVLVPVLPGFRQRYPGLRVEISVNTRFIDLVQEGVDCAIRVGTLPDSTLVSRQLGVARWMTFAAPAYLAAHGEPQSAEELRRHRCILSISPMTGRAREWVFERGEQRITIEVTGDLACGTQEACTLSSALGMGVTQVLTYAAREHVAAGRLKPVLADWAAQGPPVQIVYPRSRVLPPRVRVFVDYLAEVIGPDTLSDPALSPR
jgi:LysR family transcriptional regulator for bpeEF and oprC